VYCPVDNDMSISIVSLALEVVQLWYRNTNDKKSYVILPTMLLSNLPTMLLSLETWTVWCALRDDPVNF
jgi:hypothetical protein